MTSIKELYNVTKNTTILKKLYYAETFSDSLIGLIKYKNISDEEGFFLPYCSSIHTFFMRYPINCYFLDKDLKIIKISKNISPYWFSLGPLMKTAHVLETKVSCELNIDLNDVIELRENNIKFYIKENRL